MFLETISIMNHGLRTLLDRYWLRQIARLIDLGAVRLFPSPTSNRAKPASRGGADSLFTFHWAQSLS